MRGGKDGIMAHEQSVDVLAVKIGLLIREDFDIDAAISKAVITHNLHTAVHRTS